MDWRQRKYYCVYFSYDAYDYRMNIVKSIQGIKFHNYKKLDKIPDEIKERGYYQYMISVPFNSSELLELELRKAEMNDLRSRWFEIKRVGTASEDSKYPKNNGYSVFIHRAFNTEEKSNRYSKMLDCIRIEDVYSKTSVTDREGNIIKIFSVKEKTQCVIDVKRLIKSAGIDLGENIEIVTKDN